MPAPFLQTERAALKLSTSGEGVHCALTMAPLAAAAYCCKLRCVVAEKACSQAEMAALKLTSQAKDSSVASPGTMASHAAIVCLPRKPKRLR
eukprot:9530312-Karenia_brevis.AAC.1